MKNLNMTILLAFLVCLTAGSLKADLLECDDKKLPTLADIPVIGPKLSSAEEASPEHNVKNFLKHVGCQIKKGATKLTEQTKKFGVELKESAKKLGERAKVFGADMKTKFYDYKDKLSKEATTSIEEHVPHVLLKENVEVFNPDELKAEQQCGHGHILDALGNCSKLRK